MTHSDSIPGDPAQPEAVGFYRIFEIESTGFCGGYLILNPNGRPLEFHCTLPVQPTRAQQILYGVSMVPFLCCEHMGPPLIARATTRVQAVLVDDRQALGLNRFIHPEVAFVWQPDEDEEVKIRAARPDHQPKFDRLARQFAALDWLEPFERIQTAIDEAHAVAR